MGIYRPPVSFMYAFVSRVAAFTYGAASIPEGLVTAYINIAQEGIYFIRNEKSRHIVILVKRINNFGEICKHGQIPHWIGLLNLSVKSVQVNE